MIVFHSDLLLRRRISFSPPPPPSVPPATFREAHLRQKTHIFRGARRRSTGRWQPRRKPAADAPSRAAFLRQRAVHAPARECACGRVLSSPATGLHTQGRPAPSWCSTPPAVQPEPSLSTFWPFFASADAYSSSPTPSVHLRRLQFISSAFSSSSVIFSRILYGLDLLFLHLQAPQP